MLEQFCDGGKKGIEISGAKRAKSSHTVKLLHDEADSVEVSLAGEVYPAHPLNYHLKLRITQQKSPHSHDLPQQLKGPLFQETLKFDLAIQAGQRQLFKQQLLPLSQRL